MLTAHVLMSPSGGSMTTVRYFAAAAQAAGNATETRDAETLGALLDDLAATHGENFKRVLGRCSVLVDGRAGAPRDTVLTATSTVDVLPPFAGG